MKTQKKLRSYRGYFAFMKFPLIGIKDYILEIESKFESDIKNLEKSYKKELKKGSNDPEYKDFYAEDYQKINDTFLSTFRYSILVSVYSLVETEMNSLCRYLKRVKELSLDLSDIKGDGIEKAKIYIEKVCNIRFPSTSNSWTNIQKLNKIRNCIVHANGNIDEVTSPTKLRNIIKNTKTLHIVDPNRIKIDKKYIEEIISSVEDFLEDLCKNASV